MRITSPDFFDGGDLPVRFTCDGDGVNPRLEFIDLPNDTVGIALVVEDPDAVGEPFYHWVVWSICAPFAIIEEETTEDGLQIGVNSSGKKGYAPPCPPSGKHRYIFRAYALDTNLTLSGTTTAQQLEETVRGHVIAMAELTGMYKRRTLMQD